MNLMTDQNGITHAVPHDRITCHPMCNLGTVQSLALTEDETGLDEPDCRYCQKAIRDGAEPDTHTEFDASCGYCGHRIKQGPNGSWLDQRGENGHYVEYWAQHSPEGVSGNEVR